MSANVPVTWVDDLLDYSLWAEHNGNHSCRADLPDGAAQWDLARDQRRLTYVCPCGCKEWRQVPVAPDQKLQSHWLWDGNETAPTLTPSILHVKHRDDECGWHGFLTAGIWVTC